MSRHTSKIGREKLNPKKKVRYIENGFRYWEVILRRKSGNVLGSRKIRNIEVRYMKKDAFLFLDYETKDEGRRNNERDERKVFRRIAKEL
ncbi:hypothetical protein TNCV_1759731 [Trichonephila clavipes]|nr:hypothetical protein TNCV_1759731 [Trichonephila clavipes]